MNKLLWTLVLTPLTIVSCSMATVRLESQNKSLGEIKTAIYSLIGKPRIMSENQRELISKYYSRHEDSDFDPTRSKERLFTKYVILGEQRPYDITVEVLVEQKFEGQYELIGEDERATQKAAKELNQKLNQGRSDRNIIDDFRPF